MYVCVCVCVSQDVRDALLGRLFGLASIVRAGIVRTPTDASTVLTALLGLANKKWFVREAVMTVVTELLLGSPAATGQTAGGAGGATANGVATDADTGVCDVCRCCVHSIACVCVCVCVCPCLAVCMYVCVSAGVS